MKKVFLGGTCNGSAWREQLIPMLVEDVSFFNPVVDDWDEEAMQQELHERKNDDYILYVLTPLSEGAYSVAEVVDDSNKRPERTLMCVLQEDGGSSFTEYQKKALKKVEEMVAKNGARVFDDLEQVAMFLNSTSSGNDSFQVEPAISDRGL